MSKAIKVLMALVMVTVLLVSVTGTVLANQRVEGDPYGIEVSPNVLNIDSNANYVKIHSNIPASNLTDITLEVNKSAIGFVEGVDDLGHLVLEVKMYVVEDILRDENDVAALATFFLTCSIEVEDEKIEYIEAEDEITVISVPVISEP